MFRGCLKVLEGFRGVPRGSKGLEKGVRRGLDQALEWGLDFFRMFRGLKKRVVEGLRRVVEGVRGA